MSYAIDFNNGKQITPSIEVDRRSIDTTSTDITLFGRGRFDYGEQLNENLLHLLEHFASPQQDRAQATNPSEQLRAIAATSPSTSSVRSPVGGQLWANTTLSSLFVRTPLQDAWEPLLQSGHIACNHGTIANGATIPLPLDANGQPFKPEECAWIVTPNQWSSTRYTMVTANANRVVTSVAGTSSATATPILANYLIVGIRDNINLGSDQLTDPTSNLVVTLSPAFADVTFTAGDTVDHTIVNQTVRVGTINGPIATGLTYRWVRVQETGVPLTRTFTTETDPVTGSLTIRVSDPNPGRSITRWRLEVTSDDGGFGTAEATVSFLAIPRVADLTVEANASSRLVTVTQQAGSTAVVPEGALSVNISPPPSTNGQYRVTWSSTAIDGSGAVLSAPLQPVLLDAGVSTSSAVYTLFRSQPQTVYSVVRATVENLLTGQTASTESTIKFNFIDTNYSVVTPDVVPLEMVIGGTTSGVYRVEASFNATPNQSTDIAARSMPPVNVVVTGADTGTFIITRMTDPDFAQFVLMSQITQPATTTASYNFTIAGNQAVNYPGTNTDTWKVTFVANDGRIVERYITLEANFIEAASPLTGSVANVSVTAPAQNAAYPTPTYVVLTATPQGGTGPYTYSWNVTSLDGAPFVVVGPTNKKTLTLMLRGTTFNNDLRPEAPEVVWPSPSYPSPSPSPQSYDYQAVGTCVITDSSTTPQSVITGGTARLRFTIPGDGTTVPYSIERTYQVNIPPPSNTSYTITGNWLCNSNYIGGTATQTYSTFGRVSLLPTVGSGAYTYTWEEESSTPTSTLTAAIVTSGGALNRNVQFRAVEQNCVNGSRFYDGVWRCTIRDLYTNKTTIHREYVRLDVCRAVPGTIAQTVEKVPGGTGVVCG